MQAPSQTAKRHRAARPDAAAMPVRIYAAGSLKAAFGDMAEAMTAAGLPVGKFTFGAAGLLKERIAGGEACDLFASANTTHAHAVAGAKRQVQVFARNAMCALARADLGVTPDTLLGRMLDPAIRVGTSTPVADPSGDYAMEVFARAEGVERGARECLSAKAMALTGGRNSPKPANGRSVYASIMAEGKVDIFLTYVTNALAVVQEVPGVATIPLPPELAVAADYGLVVLTDRKGAREVADWILSAAGQDVLVRHGFQHRQQSPTEDRI